MCRLPVTEVYYHTPLRDPLKCLWLVTASLAQHMALCSRQHPAFLSTYALLMKQVEKMCRDITTLTMRHICLIQMHFHVICIVTCVNVRHKHNTFCPVWLLSVPHISRQAGSQRHICQQAPKLKV